MNELDYGIIAVMVLSVAVGAFRGAIREVMNIVAWVLAFVIAHAYARDIAPLFADWIAEPVARTVMAWIAVFAVVLVVSALIANLLSEVIRKLGLGTLDRVVGAGIGIVRGLIVVVALTLAAGLTKIPQGSLWRASTLTPWIEIMALYAKGALPDSMAAKIRFRVPSAPAAPAAPAAPSA